MPQILRTRVAFVLLFSILLIPVISSSLRGLTHVLTCSESVAAPFEVLFEPGSDPIVTGSQVLEPEGDDSLCGGLEVDLSVDGTPGGADVTIVIINGTEIDWYGTVELKVGSVRVPVGLGRVPAGSDETATISMQLPEGVSSFGGSLLIGP